MKNLIYVPESFTTPRRELAEEWALVLEAEGLGPTLQRTAAGFAVSVAPERRERAAAVLAAYARERVAAPAPPTQPEDEPHLRAGLGWAVFLLALFALSGPPRAASAWLERGTAAAERILDDEPWRVVTALTLHADLGHVVANALVGGLFVALVCGALGVGLGLLLVVVAGAGGNYVNAWFHGAPHDSIGASTAVFGAVGLLCGLALTRRHRLGLRGARAWLPVAAGLGLLAMLGTGGVRVDLWAHLFGLLVGAALGAAAALVVRRAPGLLVQCLLGASAVGILVGSWMVALR